MSKTKKIKEHFETIVNFGCLICHIKGFPKSPCEIHHIKYKNLGMSKKASDYEVIGLCPNHHRHGKESYHYSPKSFTEKWGSQKKLLELNIKFILEEDLHKLRLRNN
jgi:5-methylcytosine-specific restriction endonuclease McrA